MNFKKLLIKHKSLLLYAIFGVLTTIINLLCYQICYAYLQISNIPSVVISWIVSVLFAYFTNRSIVFNSQNFDKKSIVKELISFFGCRLATGFLDVVIMFLTVDILQFNSLLMKLLSNVLVIIINYIASKLFIFKKK
ncbi:MAG: GtrA family protein [Clostridia bacterium]